MGSRVGESRPIGGWESEGEPRVPARVFLCSARKVGCGFRAGVRGAPPWAGCGEWLPCHRAAYFSHFPRAESSHLATPPAKDTASSLWHDPLPGGLLGVLTGPLTCPATCWSLISVFLTPTLFCVQSLGFSPALKPGRSGLSSRIPDT